MGNSGLAVRATFFRSLRAAFQSLPDRLRLKQVQSQPRQGLAFVVRVLVAWVVRSIEFYRLHSFDRFADPFGKCFFGCTKGLGNILKFTPVVIVLVKDLPQLGL